MAIELQPYIDKAATLLEGLPYMQQFREKRFLVKVGGSAMEDPELLRKLLRDIVYLEAVGIQPIIVHGGGKAISEKMEKAGLEAKFINGLRYTDAQAVDIVVSTLGEEINPQLVEMINELGGQACGLPGYEVFTGSKIEDLGFVGQVSGFETQSLEDLLERKVVPVITPLAKDGADNKNKLNINADLAASALAAELKVEKLIYLSDVRGVMHDLSDESTLIPSLNESNGSSAQELIESGVISGGMIPKVESALQALDAGVGKVHLIDGRIPHSLVLEVFTDLGIGTEIVRESKV